MLLSGRRVPTGWAPLPPVCCILSATIEPAGSSTAGDSGGLPNAQVVLERSRPPPTPAAHTAPLHAGPPQGGLFSCGTYTPVHVYLQGGEGTFLFANETGDTCGVEVTCSA